MKFIPSLVILSMVASAVNAQQTTVPRTPPAAPAPVPSVTAPASPTAPTPAPSPAKAPRAYILPDDFGVTIDGMRFIDKEAIRESVERARVDADRYRYDAERIAQEMKVRSSDFAWEARIAGEKARGDAMQALETLKFNNLGGQFAPLAELSSIGVTAATNFGTAIAKVSGDGFGAAYAYAPGQSRWEWGQDPDPADSLWRVAYDAMNRGEYRRSADLFAQLQTRFPKSTRVSASAYNEAYMRYRIGSLDELKSSLRILTDKGRFTSTSTQFNNELSIMTTRVRGALAARGDAEQARIVANEARQSGGCDREDMQVRSEALSALANSDMNAAAPMLRRVLDKKDPCSLDLRRRALSILLRRADTAATSAAISVAKNADETLELRLDAIRYLSRLPGDNALSTLEDLLRTSTDRDVQRTAVSALASSENSRARSAVRAIIERNDVSEELRSEALNSFSKDRSSADDAVYIRNLYPKLQSERLKTAVISAMSRIGGAENDQFLLTLAKNQGESSELRGSAISRLSRSTSTVSTAEFAKLYDAAESRYLRSQIVNALASRKEPEALDKLIEILKTSTDTNIRNQVVGILGRHPDPKAKQALADFMSRPL